MSKAHSLWLSLLPNGKPGSIARQRRNHCLNVLQLLGQCHPDLLAGNPVLPLSSEEVEAFVNRLHSGTPDHVFFQKFRFFARGLEKGRNEYGWEIPLPAIPTIIPREPNKFTPEMFTHLGLGRKLESLYLKNLTRIPASKTIRFGQILFSAIVFGGLGNRRWHRPLFDALETKNKDKESIWMDLELFLGDEEKTRLSRRWFIDPTTRGLLTRLQREYPDDLVKSDRNLSPQVCVVRFLKAFAPVDLCRAIEATTYPQATNALLALNLPSFLSSYASGHVLSVSLPEGVWVRLLTDKSLRIAKKKRIHAQRKERPSLSYENGAPVSPSRQEELLGEFLKKFPGKRAPKSNNPILKKKLKQFHAEHKHELPPLLVLLLEWGVDLLTAYDRKQFRPGRKKYRLKSSTAYTYLTTIGRRLITVAGEFDLRNLDPDELVEVYLATKELCPSAKSKRRCGQFLFQFHQFLVIRHKFPQIDFSEIAEHSLSGEATVSANLISFQEYERILMALAPDYKKASRRRKMQYLMVVIGFRCGLRRTELLKLRLIDTHFLAEPTLLVRANRYAGLKSTRAKRLIPLSHLLSTEELQIFKDWRIQRFREDSFTVQRNSLLFCDNGQNSQLLPDAIFSPINQAMHQVAGDYTLQFRHLRHSFATWLFLRLQGNFSPEMRDHYEFLKHAAFNPEDCQILRKNLIGVGLTKKKSLYVVAQLCGHATPETTLLHYIHLCDFLLGVELWDSKIQPVYNYQMVESLTGLNKKKLDYRNKGQKNWVLQRFLLFDPLKDIKQYKIRTFSPDLSPIPEIASDIAPMNINWRQIYAILLDHHKFNRSTVELAHRHDVDEFQIVSWLKAEKELQEMQTADGQPRFVEYRHRQKRPETPLIQFPQFHNERKLVNRFFRKISQCNDSWLIQSNVVQFLETFTFRSKGIRFAALNQFEYFLKFLKIVGIPSSQIFISFVHANSIEPDHRKRFSSIIRGHKIPPKNQQQLSSDQPKAYWIQVKSETVKKESKVGRKWYRSSGFLFSMYILAVALNLKKKTAIPEDVESFHQLIDENLEDTVLDLDADNWPF